MKYLINPVKRAAGVVGNWTEKKWGAKRVDLLYTMVSGSFNFIRNKSFDSFSWSSVVRDVYTRRGCIISG